MMRNVGKMTLMLHTNNEGPGEHAHLCSLNCTFSIRRHTPLLRKHAYSNILKILLPKNGNFQIKKLIIFNFCTKHRLWVPVRTASMRRF